MTDTLMVGVSGIRGIVGKDLTDEVVGRYARAFGRWVKARTPVVVVGRDARESGPAFERAVVDGLGSVGCAVVKVGLVPTPTVQLAVEHHAAGGGIAITASHNPIEWNALKFIGPDGIFLDGADGARVQELVGEDGGGGGRTGKVATDEGAVERHLDAVLKLPAVDVERIRKRKFTVALDAVRGAGGPVMRALLERLGCEVAGINLETDGRFPRSPEPVPENLGGLSTLVTRAGAALGIAVDPDVDRLAIVDESGTPIGEDYTLAFAVRAVQGAGAHGRGRGAAAPLPRWASGHAGWTAARVAGPLAPRATVEHRADRPADRRGAVRRHGRGGSPGTRGRGTTHMCGIVGYTGPRQAAPLLLEGLRRLEYRGYDSAGLALIEDGRIDVP